MESKIISDGTLNPKHLMPLYVYHLAQTDRKLYERAPRTVFPDEWSTYWNSAEMYYDYEELICLMERAAPKGYWFGSNEGDGACIGYWPIEESE